MPKNPGALFRCDHAFLCTELVLGHVVLFMHVSSKSQSKTFDTGPQLVKIPPWLNKTLSMSFCTSSPICCRKTCAAPVLLARTRALVEELQNKVAELEREKSKENG